MLQPEFQVYSDKGHELYFSSSLMNYLAHKKNRKGFRLGAWISSLSYDDLVSLTKLANLESVNDDAQLQMLQIAVIALDAEAGRKISVNKTDASVEELDIAINMVSFIIGIEGLSRNGALTYNKPASILHNDDVFIKPNPDELERVQEFLRRTQN